MSVIVKNLGSVAVELDSEYGENEMEPPEGKHSLCVKCIHGDDLTMRPDLAGFFTPLISYRNFTRQASSRLLR